MLNLTAVEIELIAKDLNVEPATLGADIYKLAVWLETMGNRGYDTATLKLYEQATYFLGTQFRSVWKDILFYGEGSRKRDFKGWGVRKQPHWTLAWGDRYGWDTVTGRLIVDRAEEEAYAEKAKQDIKSERQRQTFAEGEFDRFTSLEIGQRWAAALITCERYAKRRLTTHDEQRDILTYQMLVWNEQEYVLKWELEWRTRYHKKEDERRTAAKILEQGVGFFYTPETVKKWISMDREPVFAAGPFEQPYDDRAQHAPFMSNVQVQRVFLELVAGERKDDISREDIELVLNILRKQLKNLRGGFE